MWHPLDSLSTLDGGIDWTATLQARAQSQLLGQLLPMVAQLPSAQARCDALARIWAAAVASDLETRRAVRTRQKTLPGAELKQLLSDTFAMEVISGSSEGQYRKSTHQTQQSLLSMPRGTGCTRSCCQMPLLVESCMLPQKA